MSKVDFSAVSVLFQPQQQPITHSSTTGVMALGNSMQASMSQIYNNSQTWQQDTLPRMFDNTLKLEDLLALPSNSTVIACNLKRESEQSIAYEDLNTPSEFEEENQSVDLTASETQFGQVALLSNRTSDRHQPTQTFQSSQIQHVSESVPEQLNRNPSPSCINKEAFGDISSIVDIPQSKQVDTCLLSRIQIVNSKIDEIQRKIHNNHPIHPSLSETTQIEIPQNPTIFEDNLQFVHSYLKEQSSMLQQDVILEVGGPIKLEQPRRSLKVFESQRRLTAKSQINDLIESQNEIEIHLEREQSIIHSLLERKSMAKEELIALLLSRADLVANMEDLEEMQETLVQKSPSECMQMQGIILLNDQIDQSHKVLQSLTHRQQEIQSEIISISNQNTTLRDENSIQMKQMLQQQQQQLLAERMNHFELELYEKCREISLELSLDDLVIDIFSQESQDVIQKINERTNSLTLQQINQVKKQQKTIAPNPIEKSYTPNEFKDKIIAYLSTKKSIQYTPEDAQIIAELFHRYFQAFLENSLLDEQNSEQQCMQIDQTQLTTNLNRISELESENSQWNSHISELSTLISAKETEVSLKYSILEEMISEQMSHLIEDYLAQQQQPNRQQQFINTRRNFNETTLKDSSQQKFYELLKQNQSNRFQQLEAIHHSLSKINNEISRNITYVESSLTSDIASASQQLQIATAHRSTLLELKSQTAQALLVFQDQISKNNNNNNHASQPQQTQNPCKVSQSNLLVTLPAQPSNSKNTQNLMKELEECKIERLALESNLIEQAFNLQTSTSRPISNSQQQEQQHLKIKAIIPHINPFNVDCMQQQQNIQGIQSGSQKLQSQQTSLIQLDEGNSLETIKRCLRTITEEQPSTFRGELLQTDRNPIRRPSSSFTITSNPSTGIGSSIISTSTQPFSRANYPRPKQLFNDRKSYTDETSSYHQIFNDTENMNPNLLWAQSQTQQNHQFFQPYPNFPQNSTQTYMNSQQVSVGFGINNNSQWNESIFNGSTFAIHEHPNNATRVTRSKSSFQSQQNKDPFITTQKRLDVPHENTNNNNNNQILKQQSQQKQPRMYQFKLHLDSLHQKEAGFLQLIKELLEGTIIFKRHSQFEVDASLASEKSQLNITHEPTGYSKRIISLHRNLTKIEIRHPLKASTIESVIHVDSMLKVTENSESQEKKKIGNQQYGFTIHLEKSKKVSLITSDQQLFEKWIIAIPQLIKLKKSLPRLKNHIELLNTQN